MQYTFNKYHGAGNDFIIFDNRSDEINFDEVIIRKLCDRHTGIGADGMMLLTNAKGFDFGMVYFNANGNEGSLCGNGGRCIVAYADKITGSQKDNYTFLAVDGEHSARILSRKQNSFAIEIAMNDVTTFNKYEDGYFTDTGSPHFIKYLEIPESKNIEDLALPLRWDNRFQPTGTNVNFIWEVQEGIKMRTYERGVEAETLACGTGATAAALIHALNNGIDEDSIKIFARGGTLEVSYKKQGNNFTNIKLKGPAEFVFEGLVEL